MTTPETTQVATSEETEPAARGSRQRDWAIELTDETEGCRPGDGAGSSSSWTSFKSRLADQGIEVENWNLGPRGGTRYVAVHAPSVAHAHACRGWDISETTALGYWRLDESGVRLLVEQPGAQDLADQWGSLTIVEVTIARSILQATTTEAWGLRAPSIAEAAKAAATAKATTQ
jgi:hypothetical protein